MGSCRGSNFQPINQAPTVETEFTQRAILRLALYLTVLYMIGRSKMNERLSDMSPNKMLDICVLPKKTF